jgi:hypothetical protein
MSLQTPSTIRTRQRKLYREAKMLGAEVSRNTQLAACRVPRGEASQSESRMPEIGTSGSMSGDGKRGVGHWPQATAPILDSANPADANCLEIYRRYWWNSGLGWRSGVGRIWP